MLICCRGRGAVTAFSTGSAASLPPIITPFSNLFLAGDYVAQGPGTHGAKGLSQEKAYVAGLQAGNLVAFSLDLAHHMPGSVQRLNDFNRCGAHR